METHQTAGGDEQQICRRHNGKHWRCKKPSGDNKLQYCDKHYKHFTDFSTKNPDERFCCHTGGSSGTSISRCKNFRMSHGAADHSIPKTKFCEKHYNYYKNRQKKKRSRDGEDRGAGTGPIETRDSNFSKLRKKVMEEHDPSLGIQPDASDDTSDTIIEGGTANIKRKRENVESYGKLESLTGIRENVVELEGLEHYKIKYSELSVELEKKKVECNTLQGKLVEVEEIRKTAAKDESGRTPADATECWRKLFSNLAESVESRILDLENIVLRMDNRISIMEGSVESRISKLESLVLRSGKGSSIMRCVELRDSAKIESEACGSQNNVTQSGGKQRDENNRSRTNAETSSVGRKDSHVHECKEKVLNVFGVGSLRLSSGNENVEEGKGFGCSEKRPSQHGSSSQDHLEMSVNPFLNLVSDDDSVEVLSETEDSDSSTDSEGSLGALMDMLAMKYKNRNKDKEIKWEFEADMLSSFEEDPELCMKAVCALYRQQICEDEISDKGLFHNSDALRCSALAKFLMDEDCEGDLNKSMNELEKFDSKGVEDCKRLARRYSTQLFSIYQNGKDPYFLPATTAIHGDETAM
ncbi:uncharacterized protein LOC113319336 isoform X1 [Papaver somniferum]|nr:uncharacterized protein LOC113319336 isoform X1 [Papaver somniferum]XP_026423390.1 uncharacterized protein LOC113319336 isoform X1 [Papaver somniferum]